jgi:site-specific recombinase XerD
MDELFNQFLEEKRYLNGVSKKTLVWYTYSYKQYKRVLNGTDDPESTFARYGLPTKHTLIQFVIGMRKSGLSEAGMNDYIRGFNVFLTWLFENEHTPTHLKVKKVKEEQTIIETFTDKQLEAIIDFKPKNDFELRLHTLLLAAIDTGCRIEELLTLTRDNVNLDSLVIKVTGKGKKERIVPISIELKKAFFKLLRKHKSDLVFCTHKGNPLGYRNMLRDFKLLGEKLGIKGVRVSFHTLRHTFAVNYVRQGGNVLYLQKAMGHTDLSMTKRYVNLQTEDLKKMHLQTSQLSRLKS